jgi:hypothetical protein
MKNEVLLELAVKLEDRSESVLKERRTEVTNDYDGGYRAGVENGKSMAFSEAAAKIRMLVDAIG